MDTVFTEKQISFIKTIYWDYNIDPYQILSILNDLEPEQSFLLSKERILLRMLERLAWFQIVSILSKDKICSILTPDFIIKIRNPELKEKYEFIRKVLFGEPVPTAGWGDEYYSKIKHTLLSNRWYSPKPALLQP